jgi:Holliday junction DNA helicase RuvA
MARLWAMIEYLRGILLVKEPDHIVVDAGGVGYGVDVPRSTSKVLPEAGEEVALHIHFHFTEQAMRLFGFFTPQERDIFEVFISISGIGPKTALGILSSIDAGPFAQAILREDYATLTRLPGVGKKTAERLVVELRDKILPFAESQGATVGGAGAEARKPGLFPPALAEAIAALEALGCKPVVAERAAQKAWELLGTEAPVEDLVREGLKHRR